jgi:hypothetical protein
MKVYLSAYALIDSKDNVKVVAEKTSWLRWKRSHEVSISFVKGKDEYIVYQDTYNDFMYALTRKEFAEVADWYHRGAFRRIEVSLRE